MHIHKISHSIKMVGKTCEVCQEVKANAQHNATTSMLHCGNGVLIVMSNVGFLPNVTLCIKDKKFSFWSHQTWASREHFSTVALSPVFSVKLLTEFHILSYKARVCELFGKQLFPCELGISTVPMTSCLLIPLYPVPDFWWMLIMDLTVCCLMFKV